MTADAIVSILEAELAAGAALAETLERQRVALIARDLEGIDELTERLQEQFAHFHAVLRSREQALPAVGSPGDRVAALLREARDLEARVVGLARLNNELLADRLARVNTVLSALLPETAAGYSPAGGLRRSGGTLARSA